MAVKRGTRSGNKSGKKVRELRTRAVNPKTAKDVRGGREGTQHPGKVVVPD